MTSLTEACKIVMQNNPGRYIDGVNEFEKAYEFFTLHESETYTDQTFFGFALPTVVKETGEYIAEMPMDNPLCTGDFVRYEFFKGDDFDNIDINERIVRRGHI